MVEEKLDSCHLHMSRYVLRKVPFVYGCPCAIQARSAHSQRDAIVQGMRRTISTSLLTRTNKWFQTRKSASKTIVNTLEIF